MKKFLLALVLSMIMVLPVNAQEITVEKGQYLPVNDADKVDIYNELDSNLIWEDVPIENIDGVQKVLIPLNNPLKTIHVHIVKGDEENVLKVHLTEPHEHQPHYVDAVRPTDTQAGSKPYFYCDCGKYFEDKACTIEITEDIDTWKYLAPIPKEEWGEGNPVPYVPEIDDKNITDPTKPNPSWTEKELNEYKEIYEEKELETEKVLKEKSIEPEEEVIDEIKEEIIDKPEVVVYKAEAKTEDVSLWDRIKNFFINLFE